MGFLQHNSYKQIFYSFLFYVAWTLLSALLIFVKTTDNKQFTTCLTFKFKLKFKCVCVFCVSYDSSVSVCFWKEKQPYKKTTSNNTQVRPITITCQFNSPFFSVHRGHLTSVYPHCYSVTLLSQHDKMHTVGPNDFKHMKPSVHC